MSANTSQKRQRSMAKQSQHSIVAVHEEQYLSGPLPSPDIFSKYEATLPGAAERILAMAERQADHRQQMEKVIIKAESRDSLLGIIFAFLLSVLCVSAALLAIFFAPNNAGAIAGGLLGVAGIGSIITVFVTATRVKNKSKEA